MNKKTLLSGMLALGLTLSFIGCAGKSTPPLPKTELDKPAVQITPKAPALEMADIDKMMAHGVECLESGDYTVALKIYREILAATDNKETLAVTYYNMACTYSLMKEKSPALEYLEKAVKGGYNDIESIEQDKDLAYLRDMTEYKTILGKILPISEIQPTAEDEKAQQEALRLIEQYRGLKCKEEPKYKIMAPDQFAKAFGGNADSIQGFYRWSDKTLYLKQGLDPVKAKGTRIHETFHAFQDQLFNTGEMQKAVKTTDAYYTVKGVIEGDATLTFIECMPDSMASMMLTPRKHGKRMGGREPVYDNSEKGEASTRKRIFDYSTAAVFIKAVKEAKGWDGVNAIYTNMPASTEQILHPEKYIKQNDPPVTVTLPDFANILGPYWKVSPPDTHGEFALALNLLANPKSGPLVDEAVAGWDGDSNVWASNRNQKQRLGIQKTVWDTPKDAKEFYDATCLSLGRDTQPEKGENYISYRSAENNVDYVSIKDSTVVVLYQVPQELLDKITTALNDNKTQPQPQAPSETPEVNDKPHPDTPNSIIPHAKLTSSQEDALSKTVATLVSLKIPELYNKYVDLNTFEVLDYNTLLERLKNIQVIYVAEQHTNEAHHKLQEDILRSLSQKNPKTVLAMEFLYRSQQQVIDDYISGKMSEEDFDKAVKSGFGDWYKYYVGLIRYAKKNNLKTVALNVEREIKRKMAKLGWDKLTPEEQKLIAKDIDTSNKAHRDFVMKQFEGMMNSPQTKDKLKGPMMDQMYLLQCMWDETFGEAIANYLKSVNDTGVQVMVVAGAGHISYKFNIPERSYKRFSAPYKTLIPVGIDGNSDITNKPDFFRQELLSGIGDYVYFSPQSAGE